MAYLAVLFTVLVALYTVFFGVEQWREKNYSGFFAIILLALVIVGLPFYILFMQG
jgi:hypothetical protein